MAGQWTLFCYASSEVSQGVPVGDIDDFEAVIGIEVHCQLALETKLFAPCRADEIDPVTLGLPGTLPVLNSRAVDFGAILGFALGSRVEPVSIFERKNYFYPDLPKGYQITQYDRPLCTGGELRLSNGQSVRIDRIQLEEDAGKTLHGSGYSLVDYRRAGVALLEIVSKPDLSTAADAADFLRRLHRLVVFYGVSDGDMELGHFRADANVSIRRRGDTCLGTRTELKNINSFRYVERAISLEIERQKSLVARGEAVVMETRGYDADRDRTFRMRTKESAQDYRYFPDPDLPPVVLGARRLESLAARAAVNPFEAALRLRQEFGLSNDDADRLSERSDRFTLFLAVAGRLRVASPKVAGSLMAAEVFGWPQSFQPALEQPGVQSWLAEAFDASASGQVTSKTLRDNVAKVFEDYFVVHDQGKAAGVVPSFAQWAISQGLGGLGDEASVAELARELVDECAAQAAELRAGKDKVMAFFVGQGMKRTQGRVDAAMLQRKIRELLGIC